MATKDCDISYIKKEEVDDMTTCCICTEIYTDPKALPCIHTFCMKCLREHGLKSEKGPGDEMPCPICRRLFKIPPEGFPGLPKNFFIERLIEMSKISVPSAVNKILCSLCLEENKEQEEKETPAAERYCAKCDLKLCEQCCNEHRDYKATKTHKLIDIDEQDGGRSTTMTSGYCDLHRQKALDVYCADCETVVCAICFIGDHKNHEGSHVDKLVHGFRTQIEDIAEAMTMFSSLVQKKQAKLGKVKEDIQARVDKLETDVVNRKEELKQLIDKQATSLVHSLHSIRQDKLKDIQITSDAFCAFVSRLETYNSFCKQIIAKGSASDMCREFSGLCERAIELEEQCEPLINSEIQSFNFRFRQTEFEELLGKNNGNLIGEIEEYLSPVFEKPIKLGFDDTEKQYRQNLEWAMEANSDLGSFIANRSSGAEIWLMSHIRARFHKLGFLPNFHCDGCGDDVSTDYYRCLDCNDVDICKTCYQRGIVPETEDHNEEHNLVLFRYLCKGCTGFIIATRWHCNECNDFDLCNGCHNNDHFPEGSSHNAGHTVSKIPPMKGPPRYISDPNLIKTIRTNSDKKKKMWFKKAEESKEIRGMTILDSKLIVIIEGSPEVEVYDSMKFNFIRRWKLKGLINPMDIVSCNRIKCLYISDWKDKNQSSEIFRVDPNGKQLNKWSTGQDRGYCLSVTDESHLLLVVFWKSAINEFSPDGRLIRKLNLSSEAGIHHPYHAIKLSSGHYVVSHGYDDDDLHRVCLLDADGKLQKSYDRQIEGAVGQINYPAHLSVDGNGFVMVADQCTGRVILLDPDMEFQWNILTDKALHRPQYPERILLDEPNHRLFVADNEPDNQRIFIFEFD